MEIIFRWNWQYDSRLHYELVGNVSSRNVCSPQESFSILETIYHKCSHCARGKLNFCPWSFVKGRKNMTHTWKNPNLKLGFETIPRVISVFWVPPHTPYWTIVFEGQKKRQKKVLHCPKILWKIGKTPKIEKKKAAAAASGI